MIWGRILIIGGAYGSGKSELALNLAMQAAATGESLVLADLDFVNPYFRSRDLAGIFPPAVEIISTAQGLETADLPAISGRIAATIRLGQQRLIIDLGGDPVGAKILRSFADEPGLTAADFWLVINPFRPFTAGRDQIMTMIETVTTAAGLSATGIIANPNLLGETTVDHLYTGLQEVKQVAKILDLPLKAVAVENSLLTRYCEEQLLDLEVEILPLNRHLLPPWQS